MFYGSQPLLLLLLLRFCFSLTDHDGNSGLQKQRGGGLSYPTMRGRFEQKNGSGWLVKQPLLVVERRVVVAR